MKPYFLAFLMLAGTGLLLVSVRKPVPVSLPDGTFPAATATATTALAGPAPATATAATRLAATGATATSAEAAIPARATTPDEAAAPAGATIPWITIEEAAGKLRQLQKPILIDLYTTWCGWCRQMDRKTYSNKKVVEYLTDKFYTVKLDAETRATINWQGRNYDFDPQYRCNMFALYLAHGRLEFPTTIIIAPGYDPQAIPGYMEPKDLELLVKFFGDGAYRTKSFDDYQKSFRATW